MSVREKGGCNSFQAGAKRRRPARPWLLELGMRRGPQAVLRVLSFIARAEPPSDSNKGVTSSSRWLPRVTLSWLQRSEGAEAGAGAGPRGSGGVPGGDWPGHRAEAVDGGRIRGGHGGTCVRLEVSGRVS